MAARIDIPRCEKCGSDRVKLRRHVISNGSYQIGWYCLEGHHWAIEARNGQWIPHRTVKRWVQSYGKTIEDIEIVKDSSDTEPCGVRGCDRPSEVHHVAPRAIFGSECEDWPTVPLCTEHHAIWHQKVTPHNKHREKRNAEMEKALHADV